MRQRGLTKTRLLRPPRRWHHPQETKGDHGPVRTLMYQGMPVEPERQWNLFTSAELLPSTQVSTREAGAIEEDDRPPWD
jgi:hypothetical protein